MSDTIRLNFVLDRADDPRLYDELARFSKGSKRVNRLRILAHDGLQHVLIDTSPPPAAAAPNDLQAASLELFGPSL
ncbi:hypothetical protein [Zemynaea arenosa]|nr:hypothetical protein [Massilia arenosa]